MKYMKVLVTGGTGLVGKALQEYAKDWEFMSSKDMNLLNYTETCEVMNRAKPSVVVHLAARVGGLYNNMSNNESMYADNTRMNLNIIQACEQAGVKRFIAILSTCIFPDSPPGLPLTEDMIHCGPPHFSNEGYAMAKRMLEVHTRLSPMDTICLIPTNLYGPHDNFNIEQAHVIPALIHKCCIAKKTNSPFKIFGTGKSVRQFLYSGDLAKIIYESVFKSMSSNHEMYICAPHENDEVSIETVARIISKKLDYAHEFDISYHDGQIKKTASNKKLLEFIPELKFSDFEDKLNYTIDWFITDTSEGPP